MKATGISTGGRDHALLPPITPTSLDCTSTVSADCSKTLAAGYEFPVVSALTLKSCSALGTAIRSIPKNNFGTFAIQGITPRQEQHQRSCLHCRVEYQNCRTSRTQLVPSSAQCQEHHWQASQRVLRN